MNSVPLTSSVSHTADTAINFLGNEFEECFAVYQNTSKTFVLCAYELVLIYSVFSSLYAVLRDAYSGCYTWRNSLLVNSMTMM